ncbi:MAG: hypothetical protein ACREXU_01940 [Gammaproteobacteria bacterium]
MRKALSFACKEKSLAREAKSLAAGALRLGRGPGEAGRRRLLAAADTALILALRVKRADMPA